MSHSFLDIAARQVGQACDSQSVGCQIAFQLRVVGGDGHLLVFVHLDRGKRSGRLHGRRCMVAGHGRQCQPEQKISHGLLEVELADEEKTAGGQHQKADGLHHAHIAQGRIPGREKPAQHQ